MYSYFYRFLQRLIVKRTFNEDLIKLIDKNKVNEIIDIGCADSSILEYINSSYSYHGYELNSHFTNKLKLKYKNNNKIKFYNKGVDEIDFNKFDPDKSIIILVGLFHHIDDLQIKRFVDRAKNFKIFAIDAVKIFGQKNITKLLMAVDKGNYIRQLDNYKKILTHFDFLIAKNRYVIFPYDHLVSTKNIDKNIVIDIFKSF